MTQPADVAPINVEALAAAGPAGKLDAQIREALHARDAAAFYRLTSARAELGNVEQIRIWWRLWWFWTPEPVLL